MGLSKTIWANPSEFLRVNEPENPVMFFSPAVLQSAARLPVAEWSETDVAFLAADVKKDADWVRSAAAALG